MAPAVKLAQTPAGSDFRPSCLPSALFLGNRDSPPFFLFQIFDLQQPPAPGAITGSVATSASLFSRTLYEIFFFFPLVSVPPALYSRHLDSPFDAHRRSL